MLIVYTLLQAGKEIQISQGIMRYTWGERFSDRQFACQNGGARFLVKQFRFMPFYGGFG